VDLSEVLIDRMNWHDVRDAIAGDRKTVILPPAAIEQHGPHMAIGTDTYLGYETETRLAHALGDARGSTAAIREHLFDYEIERWVEANRSGELAR
jgi:creatinine amidohydrolase